MKDDNHKRPSLSAGWSSARSLARPADLLQLGSEERHRITEQSVGAMFAFVRPATPEQRLSVIVVVDDKRRQR